MPAGSSQLTYQIQAIRSTAGGAWASFTVTIGVNAAATQTATLDTAVKIAA